MKCEVQIVSVEGKDTVVSPNENVCLRMVEWDMGVRIFLYPLKIYL